MNSFRLGHLGFGVIQNILGVNERVKGVVGLSQRGLLSPCIAHCHWRVQARSCVAEYLKNRSAVNRQQRIVFAEYTNRSLVQASRDFCSNRHQFYLAG